MAKKIEVTLTLNTRQFKRALASANRSMKSFSKNTATATTSTAQLSKSVAPLVAGGVGLAALRKNFTDINGKFPVVNENFKNTNKSITNMSNDINNLTKDLGVSRVGFDGTTTAVNNTDTSVKKSSRGIKGLRMAFGGLVGALALLPGPLTLVLAGITALASAFALLRTSIGTASEFQDIQLVLGNIFGGAKEGAIALKMLTEMAEKLPFAFKELAGSAPVLATVSGDLQELQDNMLLASNIAASFSIPFDLAASSLQRAFSAGAGAADIFRERGVLAAAGFEAGVSVSIEETQKKLREFGATLNENAELMNNTFSGAVSQAGDAITLFNKEIGSEALPFFQSLLVEITESFRDNKTSADTLAKTIGQSLIGTFKNFALAGAFVIDILIGIKNLFIEVVTLGGLLDGAYEKLGNVLKDTFGAFKDFVNENENFSKTQAVVEFFKDVETGAKVFREEIEKNTKAAKEFTEDLSTIKNVMTSGSDNIETGLEDVKTALEIFREELNLSKGTLEEYNALMEKLNELYKTGQIGLEEFLSLQAQLDELFGQNEGLNSFLETLGTATKTLSDDLATAFLEGQKAGDAFKNFFKTMIQQILSDIIRLQIIQPILSSLMSPFGFKFGSGGNVVRIPGMAKGGPVMANQPYVVGEQGPELFVPGRAGDIIPNGGMGGGTVTYNINAVDAPSFQALVARDPEFIFSVTEAGRRRIPGRS